MFLRALIFASSVTGEVLIAVCVCVCLYKSINDQQLCVSHARGLNGQYNYLLQAPIVIHALCVYLSQVLVTLTTMYILRGFYIR